MDDNIYMEDIDIGGMFLSSILQRELQAFTGIDLTHHFPKDGRVVPASGETCLY
jgi:hypothetical protein